MNVDEKLKLSSIASVIFHQSVNYFNRIIFDEELENPNQALDKLKEFFNNKVEEGKKVINDAKDSSI